MGLGAAAKVQTISDQTWLCDATAGTECGGVTGEHRVNGRLNVLTSMEGFCKLYTSEYNYN